MRGSVDEVFSGHVKHKDMAFMSPIISHVHFFTEKGVDLSSSLTISSSSPPCRPSIFCAVSSNVVAIFDG